MTALAEPVCLVAQGGTGKSTTLLQLAEEMVAEEGAAVPCLSRSASGRTARMISSISRCAGTISGGSGGSI